MIVGGYTVRINNLLAVMLAIFVVARLRNHLFSISKRLLYPLAAICFSLLISYLFSPYKARCFFFLGWFALTLLCYVALPYFLMKVWDVEKIFSLYLASFFCVGGYAALQFVLSLGGIHDPFATQFISESIVRPNAFCFEPSFYALYMTPFVFFYNTRCLCFPAKKSMWGLLGVNVLYLISTSSATFFAYAIYFLVLIAFPWVVERKKVLKFFLAFAGCAFLICLIFPLFTKHFFLKFFYHGFMSHHSFYERWVGVENGWKVFLQHPLVGVGLGGYPCYLMEAFLNASSHFSFPGVYTRLSEANNPVKVFEAMNVMTELMASLGLLGLGAFGYLILSFCTQIKRAISYNPQMVYCLFISVAVTFIVLQFNQGLFRTYIWVHIALVFAYLEKIIEHETVPIHHPSQL